MSIPKIYESDDAITIWNFRPEKIDKMSVWNKIREFLFLAQAKEKEIEPYAAVKITTDGIFVNVGYDTIDGGYVECDSITIPWSNIKSAAGRFSPDVKDGIEADS